MRHHRQRLLFVFCLMTWALVPEDSLALDTHFTAYTKDPCCTSLFIDYWYYRTDHFWNSSGKRLSCDNHFKKKKTSTYVEYGLTCTDTLSALASYTFVDESLNGSASGLGDFEIGWKHKLWEYSEHTISAQAVGIIPASEYRPALRYGRAGAEVNLLYSNSFYIPRHGQCGRTHFRVGYRSYIGFPSDQIRADAKVCYSISPKVQLLAQTSLEYGLFNGRSRVSQSNFALNPNYRLFKAQLQCVFHLWSIPLTLGYRWHVWGRNVGTGGGFLGSARLNF